MNDYDTIIIGCGPAGYKCALKLAEKSKKIAIIEKEYPGGTCTNSGCIPTKNLLYQSWNNKLSKYQDLLQQTEEKIKILRNGIKYNLNNRKINLINDVGKIISNNQVFLINSKQTLSTDNIVIATGSESVTPNIDGINQSNVYNSTTILNLKENFNKIVIIGGGVIGLEYATIFNNLNIEVTILETQQNILNMLDDDILKLFKRNINSIKIICNISDISVKENTVSYINSTGELKNIETDIILNACGRKAKLPLIDSNLSIILDNKGFIKVNEQMRTNYNNIYAIGDVTGLSMLAHSADLMGDICASSIIESNSINKTFNPLIIPNVIYTHPEIATCGLSEKYCLKNNIKYISYTSNLRTNGRFVAENPIKMASIIKIISEPNKLKILGLQAYSPYASEFAFSFSLILSLNITAYDLDKIIFPHPTISEAIKDACNNLINLKATYEQNI